MRLPFVRSRKGPDPSSAEALRGLEERLDRLIVIGERTNKLLERVEAPSAATPGKSDEGEQPRLPGAGSRSDGQAPTNSRSAKGTRLRAGRRRPGGEAGRSARVASPLKLHEAIIQVLLDAGEPLIANDIAARIRDRNLYEPPRSGHELRGGQVSARVGNATYRDRFVRREGRIWLADPEGERRGRTVP